MSDICTTNIRQLSLQPFFFSYDWTKTMERIKTHVCEYERKSCFKSCQKRLYKYHFPKKNDGPIVVDR